MWLAIGSFVGASWIAFGLVPRQPVLWVDVGQAVAYSTLYLCPVVAAAVAFHFVRDEKRPLKELLVSSPRSDARLVMLVVGVEVASVLGGYLAVGVWMSVRAWVNGAFGGPDLELILAGASLIGASGAVGFLTGRLAPTWFTPPILGVSLWVAFWVVSENHRLSLLTPVLGLEPTPWLPFDPMVGIAQTLWGLGLGVIFICAGLLWREWGWSTFVAMTIGIATVVPTASYLAGRSPLPYDSDPPQVQLTCVKVSDLEVCRHAAFSGILGESAAAVELLVAPLRAVGDYPTRVVEVADDASRVQRNDAAPDEFSFVSGGIASGTFDADSFIDLLALQLVYRTCPGFQSDPTRDALALWLSTTARNADLPNGLSDPVERIANWLNGIDENTRSEWLSHVWRQTSACLPIDNPLPVRAP